MGPAMSRANPRPHGLWARPANLLAQVRRLFLFFSLIDVALILLILGTAPTPFWPHRILAIVSLGWLCWWWVYGYQRERFPFAGIPIEGLALLAVSVSTGNPWHALALLYTSLYFRSLYEPTRRAFVVWLVYLAAHFSALVLSFGTPWALFSVEVIHQIPNFAMVSGVMYMLALTLTRHERAIARERILHRVSAALVSTSDQNLIHAIALSSTLTLLDQHQAMRVSFALGDNDRMTLIVTSDADGIQFHDARFELQALPDAIRAGFAARCSVAVPASKSFALRPAFAAGSEGPILFAPLFIQAQLKGMLVVVTRSALDHATTAAIESLAALIALALESVNLTENLRLSEERFRALVHNLPDALIVVDLDTAIHYQTPSVKHLLGYDPADFQGLHFADLLHPDDVAGARAYCAEVSARPGIARPAEWRVRHHDGAWRQVEIIGNNLFLNPKSHEVILTIRDISERKMLEERLAHQAYHDPLTNLANRSLFNDRLRQTLARAARQQRPLAVLYLDLDDFKTINDTFGHAVGDQVLIAVANQLQACVRAGDMAARLSGDEFAMLIEEMAQPDDAIHVAERIRAAFREPLPIGDDHVAIHASIGLTISPNGREHADELLRQADAAMYVAKRHGKGHYVVFDSVAHADVIGIND